MDQEGRLKRVLSLKQQKQVLKENYDLIVDNLDPDDVIDELIQAHLIGENAAQKVTQLIDWSREKKNEIIVDQLKISGPGAVEKLCEILRKKKRQTFIAEELEKCLHWVTEPSNQGSGTAKLCSIDVDRLKARYLSQLPTCKTDWPRHSVVDYIKLALVQKEDVTLKDEDLNEITKLTLKGETDKILKKKQPLHDLKDIFHYENKSCPRLILIIGGPGIGKTTLANEICIQWARDGFLNDDFDVIILIPLRLVQKRSLEEVIIDHVGEEDYPKLKKSAGSRCLLILEGLDEMAIDRRQSDVILRRLIEENTLLEKAVILITSRPHVCEKLVVGRRVEVVGFGDKEIRRFVENRFSGKIESITNFMKQITEYPQLHSLCYVPLNLVMLIDIFCFKKKLPSALTELYQLFIVMTLHREVVKGHVKLSTGDDYVKGTLSKMLPGISKEVDGIVYLLCKLAYHAFFQSDYDRVEKNKHDVKMQKNPKIIFTDLDLIESGIEVTKIFDGIGLLKATHTHQLPKDTVTYNFLHLTIQEFLCSIYISTLLEQKQLNLITEYFQVYPNVMIFLCGLTGLESNRMFEFLYTALSSGGQDVITAVRCIYESSHIHLSQNLLTLKMSFNTSLLPYDCLCLSWLLSYYPVSQLKMRECHIEDSGAKLLVRHYPDKCNTGQSLEVLDLYVNEITVVGLKDMIKIVRTSSTTLSVLDFGFNDIGDEGISMISKELWHHNSLTELSLGECGLSAKGAVAVSKLLMGNCTLQKLSVYQNNIGDDGISVIVEQLKHIKSLTKLYIIQCGLSLKGASVISKLLLMDSCKIQDLLMSKNDITIEGARLVLESAVNNKACQNITMNDEYKRDSKVKKMITALTERRRMK